MDDTIRKLDGLVGGNQKLNTAVSRTQLKALADVILEQQKRKRFRNEVEVIRSDFNNDNDDNSNDNNNDCNNWSNDNNTDNESILHDNRQQTPDFKMRTIFFTDVFMLLSRYSMLSAIFFIWRLVISAGSLNMGVREIEDGQRR